MRKIILALGVALFCAVVVRAETISVSLTDRLSSVRLVDTGAEGYQSLACAGLEPILEPAGAPQLLTTSVSVELPSGAAFAGVSYAAEWKTLGEKVNLAPVQPLVAFREDGTFEPAPFVGPDPALYAAYPDKVVETCGVQKMAGKALVPVRVIPFRFTNGRLEVPTKFEVRVEYTVPEPAAASDVRSGRRLLALDPSHETAPTEAYVKTDPDQPDYILIAPKNYFSLWQDYVAERQKDHPEKKLIAVNFADILAEFPVNTDDASKGYYARNDAERLHAYIRREAKKGTHYFVLAGSWYDAHGCPADGYVTTVKKELAVTTPQAQYRTNSDWGIPGIYTNPRNDPIPKEFDPGAKPCPSDTFYACCDIPEGTKYPWDSGSWDVADPEGDGIYCNEPADRIDLMPDVVVSRIGFICGMTWRSDNYDWTMEKLVKAYLAKVRRVEAKDFAGRNRFAGGGHTFSSEPGLINGNTLRDEMEFYTGSENVFDKRRASYWMDTDYVVSLLHKDWFSRFRPAIDNEYVSDTTLPIHEPDWETAVRNLHTQDWEISTVFSHGSQGGSASKVYINEYAQNATGLSKIFYAPFPCLMSYPDWSSVGNRSGTHKLSHNMSLIENPNGGAVFTIGNTRSGWGGGIINRDVSVGDGLGVKMGGYFLKAYLRENKNPGDAWLKMVQSYAPNATGWTTSRWVLVIDMALGDPMIETHGPEDYTWEGATSGEVDWDLASETWSHVDEHSGETIRGAYDHAAQVNVTATDDLTMNVGTNSLGALRLVVDQPAGKTFKLTGEGQLRVATNMVVSAGDVTFATGGGVGHEGLAFTGAKGNIRFEGEKKFYLAKIRHGGTVTFAGSNGLLDLRDSFFSFETDYTNDPLGAITTRKVQDETIDIEAIAFDGTGVNNTIRSDIPGILTRYLPEEITGHTVRLETFDGFAGAKEKGRTLSVSNGGLTIAANPNYGLAESRTRETIDIPLTLDNATLAVERIKTFTLGRDAESAQTLTVRGDSAMAATLNGRLGLFGTTTVNLAPDATLTISAPLDDRGNGRLVFAGTGSLVVDSAASLAGEVEIGAGMTVSFKALPLPNVTKLTIGDGATVILPKNGSGTYQLTPLVGSQLTVGAGVTFCNGSSDNPIEGAVANANGSVFDPSGVLAWLGQGDGLWNGRNWLKGEAPSGYVADSGTLFSDAPQGQTAKPTVKVDGEYFAKFAQFANTTPYTIEGTTNSASLVLGSLTTGGGVTFRDVPLTVSGGVYAMSGMIAAETVNTEEVHVYGGATYAADQTGFTFDRIRYIRVYFLDHLDNEPNKTTEHRVRMEEVYLNYLGSDGTVKTIRNDDISWKGAGGCWVNGSLDNLFDGNAAHTYAVSSEKQYSAELVANSKSDMSAGKVYLQVNLKYAIPMLTSFGVHSSQRTLANREMTHAYRPTRFRIEASYDGVTYHTIMPDFGNQEVGGDNPAYYGGWVGHSSDAFKCTYDGHHPTAVEVLAGGAIVAGGEHNAAFALADGAVVKAVPDKKLTVSAATTWTFAEGGTVRIDASALQLDDNPQVVLEDAKNFSFATLYDFEPSEGAALRYLDGGRIAVVASDDMHGPYTRTFGGSENWNTADWCCQDASGFVKFAKPWGAHRLDVATDVILDLSESATITVDCDVAIDTVRACETNNLASSTLTILSDGSHAITAQKLDFSGFDGDVVYGPDCGAAHVVAGLSLRLLGTGTGVLEVPSGATAILTQPWLGTVTGSGRVCLEAEGCTWTDLTMFARIQVPTIEIPEGYRLALPPDDAAAISEADLKRLSGHGQICYCGDGTSTYTTIPAHAVVSTLKFSVDNGTFALGDVSTSGLTVGPHATLSATSLADTSKIRYVRFVFLKTSSGDKVHLSRIRFSRNGASLTGDFAKASISSSPGAVESSGGASGVYLNDWLKASDPESFAVNFGIDNGYSISMSAEKMANRELYVTIDFKNSPIDMFTDYTFTSAKPSWGGLPVDWDVEVSTDGQEFVNVASVRGSSTSGNYGGKAVRVAALTVEANGVLLAKGTLAARIELQAGAVVKAVEGESLTLGTGATLALPETGTVTIDVSDVTIARGGSVDFVSGHRFTPEEVSRFTTNRIGYGVVLAEDGSLKLEYRAPKVPSVLFR